MVDGDAIEPGAEFRFTTKAGRGVDCFEEDFLSGVFGISAAMEHAKGEIEEPGNVSGEEQFELIAIARLCAIDELLVWSAVGAIEEWIWKERRVGLHRNPPMDKTVGNLACDS
jgi:hypothetical protein